LLMVGWVFGIHTAFISAVFTVNIYAWGLQFFFIKL
jgi:hypothetical protein